MPSDPHVPPDWLQVQQLYADVPGEEGHTLRHTHYAPYFLRFGKGVLIEEGCRFFHPDRIVLEDDVRINIGVLVYGSGGVWIGRHARIGPRTFIHSANHDVSDNPKAFFERGYDYAPVHIGDNTLVSANVSLLPGLDLGSGSFIACGAVVPGRKFPAQARLLGVPAKDSAQPRSATVAAKARDAMPDVAILVPGNMRHWRDVARHILTPLGLPQVSVMEEGEPLPASVHSVIALGPEGWMPEAGPADLWHFEMGEAGESAAASQLDFTFPGAEVTFPTSHALTVVADGRNASDPVRGQVEQNMFWLIERLAKGAGPLSDQVFREWDTTLQLLELQPGREDRLLETLQEQLARRRPNTEPPQPDGSPLQSRRDALLNPVLLVEKALEISSDRSEMAAEDLQALVREVLPHASTAQRLLGVGLAATLLEDKETAEEVDARLAGPEWSRPGLAFPNATPGANGLCYSPLTLAWRVMRARQVQPDFVLPEGIGQPKTINRPLRWGRLKNGGLLDPAKKEISRSLVDNWLLLHSAPVPAGMQYRLTQDSYRPVIRELETAWFEIVRCIQHDKSRPLLRLRPWPAGYKAAVSLRYDVDRPISAERIRELVGIQRRLTNGPCASWYYFEADSKRTEQSVVHARYWQETGLHAEQAAGDALEGLGITHHSAPTSDYWRGDTTNATLDKAGASYCEFLAAQTLIPRPTWHASSENGYLGDTWSTPLHFPLEGSTKDADLAYFDRLVDEFNEALSLGGHVVIGSHPDLNQDILEELLQRELLSNDGIWFASIRHVVDRCRQVLGYGQVTAKHEHGGIALISDTHIADLSVEAWMPEAKQPSFMTVQLLANQPRILEFPEEEPTGP